MSVAVRQEQVAAGVLNARLRQLGAEWFRDRSSAYAHVYYARPLRQWLRVTARAGGICLIEYFQDCPCSGAN